VRIIVLDCYSRMGLAVINALDRGYELVGGGADKGLPRSRRFESYLKSPRLSAIFRYPDPGRHEDDFHEAILDACRRFGADGVFPASSGTAVALSRLKQHVGDSAPARFAIEDYDKIVQLADKWTLYQLARELDIPTPRTVLPVGEGRHELAELELPVVAKPRMAEAAHGLRFIDTREELDALVDSPPEVGSRLPGEYPYVVQEVIPGEIHGAGGCWQAGRPVSLMTNHRVFTRHEFGGNGLVHRTTYEPEIMEYATRMLERLEWNGPILLEFIRDSRGGYHLLDGNTRVWGSTELAVAAGLNICQQAVDIFVLGKELPQETDYEVDMVCKWLTPGTLARCFRHPRTPSAIASRLGMLLAPNRKGRTITNLRWGSLRHLAGMVTDNAVARVHRRTARARRARATGRERPAASG
jgi:hypothetical protein